MNSLPTYPSGVEGGAMDKQFLVELLFAVGASAAGAAIATLVGAGPLDPPAKPTQPLQKTCQTPDRSAGR